MNATPVVELTFHEVAGSPWEGRTTVCFRDEPGEPLPVREGLTGRQREDIRWYIEQYMDFPEGGNAVRARKIERELADYGQALWDGLQGPAAQAWLGAVQSSGEGRLELRAADPRDEIALGTPWELMRVGPAVSGSGMWLHRLGVSVVRRVSTRLPRVEPPDTSHGLRILTIVCRPDDAGFLDPRYTPEAILDALVDRPEVSVDFCRPGTLAALYEALRKAAGAGRPYHVVHFDGHGGCLPGHGGVLCFETAEGIMDLVEAERFGELVARFRVPLVVLEACRTATQLAGRETVAGVLVRQGVGTVVAMGHAVHVDMTRRLMQGFYRAIAHGRSLGQALQAARNRVLEDPIRSVGRGPDASQVALQDWFVPQLYQGDHDPVLLPERPSPRKPKPRPLFIGFLDEPRAGFQGRGYELHRLERAVLNRRVVVVHAPGGMGKTTLAREAAHWWNRTGLFPDGAVFVSLERTPSPEALLNELGQALEGIDFLRREDKQGWLADQFSKRRMLLVWDNYESILPAFNHGNPTPPEFAQWAGQWTEGPTRILVTCRDPQTGLDAWPFPLGELSKPEGLLLLVRYLERLGINRTARVERGWTSEALLPIVERTGGHPLALELLAPYIEKLGPEQVVEELGPLLAKAEQEHPEARNRSMLASLDFSIRHLSPQARAALPAVALLCGGCLEEMASMVADLDAKIWSAVREELERTGLVRVRELARVQNRFLLPHPVLAEVESLAPCAETSRRFVAVVLDFCTEIVRHSMSADARIALNVLAGCEATVRRAIHLAAKAGDHQVAWAMGNMFKMLLELIGRGGDGARIMSELQAQTELTEDSELTQADTHVAISAAEGMAPGHPEQAAQKLRALLSRLEGVSAWDTRLLQAQTLMSLAKLQVELLHRPEEALEPLERAEALLQALDRDGTAHPASYAILLGRRANALRGVGRLNEAVDVARQALELDRQRGDQSAMSRGLAQIGDLLRLQGRFPAAQESYRQASVAAAKAGDHESQGMVSHHLGLMALDQDDPHAAADHLRDAFAAFERADDKLGQMQVLIALGGMEYQRGNREAALAWFDRALELAEELGDVEGSAAIRTNRAGMLAEQAAELGDPKTSAQARRLFNQAISEGRAALGLAQQLGQDTNIASAHTNLAACLRRAGLLDEAETHARQALAIFEALEDRNIRVPLTILRDIAHARGDAPAAAEYRRRIEATQATAAARAAPGVVETTGQLLQLALWARRRGASLEDAFAAGGAGDLLPFIEEEVQWLAAHLRALAGGQSRPAVDVPQGYQELVNQAWATAGDQ